MCSSSISKKHVFLSTLATMYVRVLSPLGLCQWSVCLVIHNNNNNNNNTIPIIHGNCVNRGAEKTTLVFLVPFEHRVIKCLPRKALSARAAATVGLWLVRVLFNCVVRNDLSNPPLLINHHLHFLGFLRHAFSVGTQFNLLIFKNTWNLTGSSPSWTKKSYEHYSCLIFSKYLNKCAMISSNLLTHPGI